MHKLKLTADQLFLVTEQFNKINKTFKKTIKSVNLNLNLYKVKKRSICGILEERGIKTHNLRSSIHFL